MPTMLVPLDWETVKHELREMVRNVIRMPEPGSPAG
jgi:hypothetical protein